MDGSLRRTAAVAAREVRALAQNRGTFFLRAAWAAGCALFVAAGMSGHAGQALGRRAEGLFSTLVWAQCIAAPLLGALLAIGSVAAERRQRTLGLLVLSRLRPLEVVAGKLIALLGILGMLVLAPLPVFGLLGWAGGLEYVWLAKLAVLSIALAAFGLAAGLSRALRYRNAAAAGAAALLFLLLVLWILPRLWNGACIGCLRPLRRKASNATPGWLRRFPG